MKANWTSEQTTEALSIVGDIIQTVFRHEEDFLRDVMGLLGECELVCLFMASERCYVRVDCYGDGCLSTTVKTSEVLSWLDSRSAGERG